MFQCCRFLAAPKRGNTRRRRGITRPLPPDRPLGLFGGKNARILAHWQIWISYKSGNVLVCRKLCKYVKNIRQLVSTIYMSISILFLKKNATFRDYDCDPRVVSWILFIKSHGEKWVISQPSDLDVWCATVAWLPRLLLEVGRMVFGRGVSPERTVSAWLSVLTDARLLGDVAFYSW